MTKWKDISEATLEEGALIIGRLNSLKLVTAVYRDQQGWIDEEGACCRPVAYVPYPVDETKG